MSEVEFLRESLRKAQQERDHYRSETARLRTENAKLQNDIDAVFAQLSDMDGLRRMHEVSGELNAGANANSLVDVLVKVDPDEPDPEVIDLCSENEQDPAAAVRLKSLKRPRSPPVRADRKDAKRIRIEPTQSNSFGVDRRPPGSMMAQGARSSTQPGPQSTSDLRQTTCSFKMEEPDDQVTMSDVEPAEDRGAISGSDGRPAPKSIVQVENKRTQASCLLEGLMASHLSNEVSKRSLTLSEERAKECLRNVFFSFLPSPSPSINVSRHFLAQKTVSNQGGVARLKYSTISKHPSTRRIIMEIAAPYFPVKFGCPGLFLSCDKEVLKDDSRTWSCFASMPKSPRMVKYMGEYCLRRVDEMSPAEFNAQNTQAQKRHARFLISPQSGKGKSQKKNSRASINAFCKEATRSYANSQQKISILLMKYVEYDNEFARALGATFNCWKIEEKLASTDRKAKKSKRKIRAVNAKKRVARNRQEGTEDDDSEESEDQEESDDEDSEDNTDSERSSGSDVDHSGEE